MASSVNNTSSGGFDLPSTLAAVTFITTLALLVMGIIGWAGVSSHTYGWALLGTSVVLTGVSVGSCTPATLVTAVLAILGLTGVLPFTTVGLGVTITMGLALAAGIYLLKKC